MKKIFKISAIALALFVGISCENDDQTIATPSGGPELLSPADGNAYVLNRATPTEEVTTFVWNHADYDVQTEVNYYVEFALADTDFATIASTAVTTNRYYTFTHESLNALMLELGAIPFIETTVDVRIKSTLGANDDLAGYSNVITLKITPYPTSLPKIAVPGNHQDWSPATAPELAASEYGKTNYEGYITLNGGFKFIAPNDSGAYAWGNTDWGDDGSFSGVLLQGSQTNCEATAGYYRVKANTGAVDVEENPNGMTYSITSVSWGVVGSATGSWDIDQNMTYDSTTKKWSLTITLSDGEIKFRANDSWDINLGAFDPNKTGNDFGGEDMSYGGPNIAVSAGTYLIELDLSNPRAYNYTVTAQ